MKNNIDMKESRTPMTPIDTPKLPMPISNDNAMSFLVINQNLKTTFSIK